MIFGAGAVLIVACALHVAWLGRLARDRGRNVVAWILCGLMAGGVGLRIGVYVMDSAAEADGAFASLIGTMAPLPLTLAGMLIVAGVLYKLPTQVMAQREWKVSSARGDEATLMLEREAIQIKWADRTDTIARAQLRSAVADGECVRLTWDSGEVLLMPMMAPHTRQGRIRQSELLAKLIAPRDTAA